MAIKEASDKLKPDERGRFLLTGSADIFRSARTQSASGIYGQVGAFPEMQSQYYGGLLESLIYMEFCKQASWSQENVAIYHFRDNKQHEVDIVLERGNGKIMGIEIKASSSVKSQDFKGLVKLAEFSGDAFEQVVLFYTGQEILPFKYAGLTFYAIPIGLFSAAQGVVQDG